MSLTISELVEYARQRLQLPASELLRLRTLVPNALQNLARDAVNDYEKRRLLLTDQTTVTTPITNAFPNSYSELSTVIANDGVMPDYLQYGTTFYLNTHTFTSIDVDVTNNVISIVLVTNVKSSLSFRHLWEQFKIRWTPNYKWIVL